MWIILLFAPLKVRMIRKPNYPCAPMTWSEGQFIKKVLWQHSLRVYHCQTAEGLLHLMEKQGLLLCGVVICGFNQSYDN
jgi:hypothetical protein